MKHSLSGVMVQIVCGDERCGCVSSHDINDLSTYGAKVSCGSCGEYLEVTTEVTEYANKVLNMVKFSQPTKDEDLFNMAMFLAVHLDDMNMISAEATRELCSDLGYDKSKDYT